MTETLVQGSDAWKEARAWKITASLAAACLGLDPYKSRQAAWREITGRAVQQNNPFIVYGRQNEAEARSCYEAETGRIAVETGLWVHQRYHWLAASPDGLVNSEGLLECKCPQTLPTRVPRLHRIQMLIQLLCTGRKWCDYYAWTPEGSFLSRVRIYPHTTERVLVRRLKQFYKRHVLTGIEPFRKGKKLTRGGEAWLTWLAMLPPLDSLNYFLGTDLANLPKEDKREAWGMIVQYATERNWHFDRDAKAFREAVMAAAD